MARDSILDDPATYSVYKTLGPERFADYLRATGYGTDEGIGGVDEEDTTDAEDAFAARPGLNNQAALGALSAQGGRSISGVYDRIRSDITKRYRQPGIGDLLMAVGTSMMAPPGESDRGGFAGSLQRGLQGIGTYAKQRTDYKDDLNKMMSQIDIKEATDLADLEQKYLAAAAKAPTQDKVSFNPVTGTMQYTSGPNIGQPVPGQPGLPKTGGVEYKGNVPGYVDQKGVWQPLPERANWVPETRDGITGQVNTSTGEFKPFGEKTQERKAALLSMGNVSSTTRRLVGELVAAPGLSAVVGLPNPFGGGFGGENVIPGTDAANFLARHKQIVGQVFLSAYEALKGGGPITDVEGKKAEAAKARMELAQSEEEYKKAALEFADAVDEGYAKMQAAYGPSMQPSTPGRPAPRSTPARTGGRTPTKPLKDIFGR